MAIDYVNYQLECQSQRISDSYGVGILHMIDVSTGFILKDQRLTLNLFMKLAGEEIALILLVGLGSLPNISWSQTKPMS